MINLTYDDSNIAFVFLHSCIFLGARLSVMDIEKSAERINYTYMEM